VYYSNFLQLPLPSFHSDPVSSSIQHRFSDHPIIFFWNQPRQQNQYEFHELFFFFSLSLSHCFVLCFLVLFDCNDFTCWYNYQLLFRMIRSKLMGGMVVFLFNFSNTRPKQNCYNDSFVCVGFDLGSNAGKRSIILLKQQTIVIVFGHQINHNNIVSICNIDH
jgi:hypothetical protein